MVQIESLLSARLFMQPQIAAEKIYFISNLSGKLSLYAMRHGGSVPEPLLPPHIALQNPHLVGGEAFIPFRDRGQILVMIDRDGDENYQPMTIPLTGGYPSPAFGDFFDPYRVSLSHHSSGSDLVYLVAESREREALETYQADLRTGRLVKMGESPYGLDPAAVNDKHTRAILMETYSTGDDVLYLWSQGSQDLKLLYGVPLHQRTPDQKVPLTAFQSPHFTAFDRGILVLTALFEDTIGLGYIDLEKPQEITPVAIHGTRHAGLGELEEVRFLKDSHYLFLYNIDGVSWAYEGYFDEPSRQVRLERVLAGQAPLNNGVIESIHYDRLSDRFALSFSTATSPTQIFTLEGAGRQKITQHTQERLLGIPDTWLSAGEDASFSSFDGMRISARLYLPAAGLGYMAPYPLVYYIHGGPQSQERPDFAWFSMPLIQYLTLNGLAVFVPNVRGSSGYGLKYTKEVDRDWGGRDRLDHVQAMKKILPKDGRLDTSRTGVVGRSYGGYMTLTLAGRHPDLWSAAVDMFGPFDLLTFSDRIPPTWKPAFHQILGDPVKDRDFLVERSPRTYIDQLACPLLVIQGKNDPRVVERESRDLVDSLKAQGKDVEYLMFENEGHDVLKFDNRVQAYETITSFFKKHLRA